MGMDICLFVEKLRRPKVYELVDPPSSRSGSVRDWRLVRDHAAFRFLEARATSGLPHDVSGDLRRELSSFPDPPAFSWVGLKDVLESDINQVVECRATVDVPGYREFLRTGNPPWVHPTELMTKCRDVPPDEMKRIAEGWSPGDKPYRTDLVYRKPVREACPDLLAFLEEVRREGDPETLRLIFGLQ